MSSGCPSPSRSAASPLSADGEGLVGTCVAKWPRPSPNATFVPEVWQVSASSAPSPFRSANVSAPEEYGSSVCTGGPKTTCAGAAADSARQETDPTESIQANDDMGGLPA